MAPVDRTKILHQAGAEFLGMVLFVYFGTGSVISTGQQLVATGAPNAVAVGRILPIAFAFGISIVVQAYTFGHVSGGHFNPAVTLCLGMVGACDNMAQMAAYMTAQFLGATIGSLMLWASTESLVDLKAGYAGKAIVSSPPFELGANSLNPEMNQGNGFVLEFMGTCLLLCAVLGTAIETQGLANGVPHLAPLAIGLAVFIAHITLVPLTGCGINPARTFGPALVNSMAGNDVWTESYWIYFVAPCCASLVCAAGYKWIVVAHKIKIEAEAKEQVRQSMIAPVKEQVRQTMVASKKEGDPTMDITMYPTKDDDSLQDIVVNDD